MRRRCLWVVGGLSWAAGVLVTARPPSSGAGWRFAFVAFALVGCAWWWLVLRDWAPGLRSVLLVAVMLRAVVFPLEPSLSDDGYRYVWDGMLQAQEGVSPYAYRPSDAALGDRHEDVVYLRMNSPDYYSVYPPVSQAVFALAGMAYGTHWRLSWYVIKLIVVLVELLGVVCLVRVVGPAVAALYAWHPLAVIEVAGQGHTEGLLVGALGVLLWASVQRPVLAGAALAWAGWVKLYPFALGAVVARWGRVRALAAAGVVGTVLVAPFASPDALAHVSTSLGLYAGTFDFYSAPYLLLKNAFFSHVEDPGRLAAAVLTAGWLGAVGWAIAVGDGTVRWARWATGVVVIAFAVTSPTLHPWHFLAAIFCAPLLQINWLWWLPSISLATYISYVWPPGHGLALWVGWGGAALLFLFSRQILPAALRHRGWTKWNRLRPHLQSLRPGARVLDLGSGEGYVADAAAQDRGIAVTGADVVAYGHGARAVDLYDGVRLPYETGKFDSVVVVFVLHHSEEPEAVLAEAVRVAAGTVVILETIWAEPWQKVWLERLDRFVNRVRSRSAIDETPLDIRSDSEWRAVITSLGLTLLHARTWGGLHPQALYVLEGHGATASRTLSADAVRASSQVAVS